ncbi:MAG TPA: glucan biosynthesis protein G [Beijerinckiaceae bacterium]|nr:glucan biosynthesis protein G [Beijerinckiaceae bacterium]
MADPGAPISRRGICLGLVGSTLAGAARGQAPGAGDEQFGFAAVIEQARRLARAPYRAPAPPSHPPLSYDAYRDVRFRPDRAFLNEKGSRFRMQLFPTGSVGSNRVSVNIVREGRSRPVAFSRALFEFGPHVTKSGRAAVDGFAGLRLHYPLNRPTYFDEVIAFLGASYFRFVGRGQLYGQSTRGLAIGAGDPNKPEEFPIFREFWVVQPTQDADHIEVMALLDSPSLAGAYRLIVRPGGDTQIDVRMRLFARVSVDRLGLAPMTSMYFTGESGPRILDDFRREVHDSSGLLVVSNDEWTWRPLRNPPSLALSEFAGPISGFGLLQRMRSFDAYQDLEANYQRRPSYWVEPLDGFQQGSAQLVELPEQSEADDNIVALWRPDAPLAAGASKSWSYRISTRAADPDRDIVARARHTLIARSPRDLIGAAPGAQRFLVDYGGRELQPYLSHPNDLQIGTSVSHGRVSATSIEAHPEAPLLRVRLDVIPDSGQRADMRLWLSARGRRISEIWSFPAQG